MQGLEDRDGQPGGGGSGAGHSRKGVNTDTWVLEGPGEAGRRGPGEGGRETRVRETGVVAGVKGDRPLWPHDVSGAT